MCSEPLILIHFLARYDVWARLLLLDSYPWFDCTMYIEHINLHIIYHQYHQGGHIDVKATVLIQTNGYPHPQYKFYCYCNASKTVSALSIEQHNNNKQ